MACEICKGTGKVQLLLSSVDCDCVEPQRSGFGVSDERFKDMAARCGLGPAQALLMRKANRGEGLWGRACGRTTAMLVEAACALEDGKAVHLVTASIGSREICDRFESLAARAGVRGRISATRTCSWFGGDKPGWTTFVDHDVRVIVSRHAPEEILTLVLSALEQDERTKGMVYRVSVGDDSIALVELGHECAYTVDHSRFLHPEAASEGKAWAAALVDSLWSEWERDAGQRRREAADAVTDIGSLPMDMREQAKAAVQLALAEAFTLHHAERRLHDDPLGPNRGCVGWKLTYDLPLTEREDVWLEPQRVAWRDVLLARRVRAVGIERVEGESADDFSKRLARAGFDREQEERARWEKARRQ